MTAMRSPTKRSLLSFRFGVFVLFFVESLISIILSGGNLANKAASPVSINYNLILLVKSVIAFMWMAVIVLQEVTRFKVALISSVWCELTWVSIFSVTELGGGIVLLQESLHPLSFCSFEIPSSKWSICYASGVLSGTCILSGFLLTTYLFILGSISLYHGWKYPIFDLLCSVREFNWFPAAGSDKVKMSYESSVESFFPSQHIRGASRGSPRNMADLERALPVTVPRTAPPRYTSTPAQDPRRVVAAAASKPRPPPLKLATSNTKYSSPAQVAPISFVIEPQRVVYSHRPLANIHQPPYNKGPQFGVNYI